MDVCATFRGVSFKFFWLIVWSRYYLCYSHLRHRHVAKLSSLESIRTYSSSDNLIVQSLCRRTRYPICSWFKGFAPVCEGGDIPGSPREFVAEAPLSLKTMVSPCRESTAFIKKGSLDANWVWCVRYGRMLWISVYSWENEQLTVAMPVPVSCLLY